MAKPSPRDKGVHRNVNYFIKDKNPPTAKKDINLPWVEQPLPRRRKKRYGVV